jgi:hypothetical protein
MTEALIFFGESAAGNLTIFKSMGTPASTAPIVDMQLESILGGELAFPGPILLGYGNKILAQGTFSGFSALWIYDGTAGAYAPFRPTAPSGSTNYNFSPAGFVEYNGLVYFNGTLIDTGSDLFSTDGTVANTVPITSTGLNPTSLAVAYNKLFFAGNPGGGSVSAQAVLYSYDGSSPPAPVGIDVQNPSSLASAFVGTLYTLPDPNLPLLDPPPQPFLFLSGEDSTGTWLFQYDGSNLTKIAPTTAPSGGLAPFNLVNLEWVQTRKVGPFNLETWHRALCFSGVSASGGRAVWISFGTAETTTQIPMPSGWPVPPLLIEPYNLTPFNGMLYFSAFDSAYGQRGMFVYDPVANETRHIIAGFNYFLESETWLLDWGGGALNQYTMAVFGNKLYFNACQGGGPADVNLAVAGPPSLWCIDGAPTTGFATPTLVGQAGLQPFSLTTASF